jgi:RNA-directed DNA polymerase
MMHGPEKSDLGIVAMKSMNKLRTSAESMERRPGAKGNAEQRSTCRTQSRESVQRSLLCVRRMRLGPAAASACFRLTQGGSPVR